jgi:hypothetical protein
MVLMASIPTLLTDPVHLACLAPEVVIRQPGLLIKLNDHALGRLRRLELVVAFDCHC